MTHRASAKLGPTPTFDDPTLTMFGLLTRLQAYNEGAAREIAADNPFASASCIRSLAEVVALLATSSRSRGTSHGFPCTRDRDRISVGKLEQGAQREAPGFAPIYAQLSNLAHQSYAGSTTSMDATEDGRFTWQSAPKFKTDDDARALYLWLLEFTDTAGLLWCKLYDAVRSYWPPDRALLRPSNR